MKLIKLRYCSNCDSFYKTTRKHTRFCYECRIEKNPKLKFIMENPRGSMYRSPLMANLRPYDEATTYYCLYGDKRQKRTDFFNNFDLQLKKGVCGAEADFSKLSLCEKYKIPQPLINSIFKQLESNKISNRNKKQE